MIIIFGMRRILSAFIFLFLFCGFALIAPKAFADFRDVDAQTELGKAITTLQEQDIIQGFAGNIFLPHKQISRAAFTKMVTSVVFTKTEIATCLYDSGFTQTFRDVDLTDWFAPYICIAKKKNLINGYSDQTFRPELAITYAEAAKIVAEAAGVKVPLAGEWHHKYWSALSQEYSLENIDFSPLAFISRGDTALLLSHVFYQKRQLPVTKTKAVSLNATPSSNYKIPSLPSIDLSVDTCPVLVEKVFTAEKQTAADCLKNETFDAARQSCEQNCQSNDACQRDEKAIADFAQTILTFSTAPVPDEYYFHEDTPIKITHYQIKNFGFSKHEDFRVPQHLEILQEDKAIHAKIWSTLVNIFPHKYLAAVKDFVIFSDGVDGSVSDTLRNTDDNGITLRFDPIDIADLIFVLTHEYAHMIALSEQEDQIGSIADICQDENFAGKAKMRDSYLKEFRKQFWLPYGEKFLQLEEALDDKNRRAIMEALGKKYAADFLTDYALWSSEEDFAESFAVFVWSDLPIQRTPAYDKIRFFYAYPELMRLRETIRWQMYQM